MGVLLPPHAHAWLRQRHPAAAPAWTADPYARSDCRSPPWLSVSRRRSRRVAVRNSRRPASAQVTSLDEVGLGCDGVAAAVRCGPGQDAGFGLGQGPAMGLLDLMVPSAQRRQIALAG